MTEKQMYAQMEKIIREKMMAANSSGYKDGFKAGIIAAAQFAGTWDNQISGTEYRFEDVILMKFNLIAKRKMRKKPVLSITIKEVKNRVKVIMKKDDEYLKDIMNRRPR